MDCFYCNNNSINNCDPTGCFFKSIWEKLFKKKKNNYDHNKDSLPETEFIDQNQPISKQIDLGKVKNSSSNDCSWIAIYNALKIMGDSDTPANIVKYIESNNGLVFGGRFGVYPNTIKSYFVDKGYKVTKIKKISKLEDALKNQGKTAIVYADCKGLKRHYYAIYWNDQAGKYYAYNGPVANADLGSMLKDGYKGMYYAWVIE